MISKAPALALTHSCPDLQLPLLVVLPLLEGSCTHGEERYLGGLILIPSSPYLGVVGLT